MIDWKYERSEYSGKLCEQRTTKTRDKRKRIPTELYSIHRKQRNTKKERTAIFCSSIALRNSLKVAPASSKRKPFISHRPPQGLSKDDQLVPRAEGKDSSLTSFLKQ